MRRTNTQPLKVYIEAYLRSLGLDKQMSEMRLIRSWEEVAGKYVARSTTDIYIKNRVLFVSVQSSILRSELLMHKSLLIERLNQKAESKLIDDIVLR